MRPGTTVQKGAIAADLRAKVWPALDAGRCPPLARVTADNNGSGTVKLSGIRLAGVGGYQRLASAANKTYPARRECGLAGQVLQAAADRVLAAMPVASATGVIRRLLLRRLGIDRGSVDADAGSPPDW